MLNKTRYFPLTVALGLIFSNFYLFKEIYIFRMLGKVLIVLSLVLFFVRYWPLRKVRGKHD